MVTELERYMQEMRIKSQIAAKEQAKKQTITTSKKKTRKHQHFTLGDTGYAPGATDRPVNIRTAKRR